MASGEAVAKGCGNVFGRLFDHRAAIRGENRYFVKEFEKKRGNRDYDQIKQSVEMVKDVQHCLLPENVKMSKDFLTPMQEKVNEVLSMVSDALQIEQQFETTRQVKDKRVSEKDLEDFLADCARKRQEVDDECEQKLSKFKSDLFDKNK